jgi:hypothetical protein
MLSKRQVVRHFDTALKRLCLNKRDNAAAITAIISLKKYIEWTVPERKLPYYWGELVTIFDAVRTENDMLVDPTLKPFAEIQAVKANEMIATVPTVTEKRKIVIDFRYGAMRE